LSQNKCYFLFSIEYYYFLIVTSFLLFKAKIKTTEEQQQNQNYSLGKKVPASFALKKFKRPFGGEG
jgi:hypothetical protein